MIRSTHHIQFWIAIFSGMLTWILGSLIWYVFFVPKLKEKGYMD